MQAIVCIRDLLKLSIGVSRMKIVTIYRPPPLATSAFYKELADIIDEVSLLPGSLIVNGDVNCPGNTGCDVDDSLITTIADHEMVPQVRSATHIASNTTSQ